MFYFDLNGTKEVGVKATSDDECECAIFSIQSITVGIVGHAYNNRANLNNYTLMYIIMYVFQECPPSELYSTTRSLGMHQTITSSGYMTVDVRT